MNRLQDIGIMPLKSTGEAASPQKRTRRRLKTVSPADFREKSRLFVYEMSEAFCKILPAYSPHVQGDLSKLLIVHALGASNIQRLMGSAHREGYDSMDQIVPGELQVPANALSIADATGLARETVRRKLKELVAAEFVMEDERGGYRLKPGAVQTDDLHAVYYANFKAMVAVFEACLDAKLVELE
jgi:DNA-binding transcriptional ArsR family regulator